MTANQACRDTDPAPFAAGPFLPLLFVVEHHLAVAEVAAFDPSLGFAEERLEAFDAGRSLRRRGFLRRSDFLRAEAAEQDFVVEREELAVGAGIALAAAAADELAVDAPGFVHLGADHVQAAEFGDAGAEPDVGAAAGHVRGDGDFALLAGGGDDLGFAFDVPGVEHRRRRRRASASKPARCSLLSIDRVPISTGRPVACCASTSSTIACPLLLGRRRRRASAAACESAGGSSGSARRGPCRSCAARGRWSTPCRSCRRGVRSGGRSPAR